MRLCALSVIWLACLVVCGPATARAETQGSAAPAAPVSPQPETPADTAGSNPPAPTAGVDAVCQRIEAAAVLNGLPLEFLTRLIWQESRFDQHAVSRAGAQGIAQFMPKTAEWIGLDDPFDASTAIDKSAALLRSLRQQFGNLGLAAAAYNAGPKRVSDWLEHRRALPHETLAYVKIVTGHAADEWTAPALTASAMALPQTVPCPDIVKLFAEHRGTIAVQDKPQAPMKAVTAATTAPTLPWGVQLIGGPSEPVALASFRQMQQNYRAVLGSREPMVLRTAVGAAGAWYRVRVGANSRGDAERLCSSLRAAGGSCLVQPN